MEQSLGKAIRRLRRQKGLQQKYVALSSGLGKPRYSKIENGEAPTDRELVHIADAMNTDMPTLIRYWSGVVRRGDTGRPNIGLRSVN